MTTRQVAAITIALLAYSAFCLLLTSAPYLLAIWVVKECAR